MTYGERRPSEEDDLVETILACYLARLAAFLVWYAWFCRFYLAGYVWFSDFGWCRGFVCYRHLLSSFTSFGIKETSLVTVVVCYFLLWYVVSTSTTLSSWTIWLLFGRSDITSAWLPLHHILTHFWLRSTCFCFVFNFVC